jgi:hypothetical protein
VERCRTRSWCRNARISACRAARERSELHREENRRQKIVDIGGRARLQAWAGKLNGLSQYQIFDRDSRSEVDNRSYAALCLAHLSSGNVDPEVVKILKESVQDEKEDKLVRLSAYGALLEIAKSESGFDFQAGDKNLSDIDWHWVESL